MKKFIVYIHTFKTSKKSYIGYTSFSIYQRLHKHFINATYGIDTKFYRAIRKYGLADIESKILCESTSEEEIKIKEKENIKLFDTFRSGYNMTEGGDGGNCTKNFDQKRLKEYRNKIKQRTIGEKNPNYSGLTDEQIVNAAVVFFTKKKKFIRRWWMKYCKNNKLPQTYSKCRFNGNGYNGLVEELKKQLTINYVNWKEEDFILSKEERYKSKYD